MSRPRASSGLFRAATRSVIGFAVLATAVRAAWAPIGPEAGDVRPAAIIGSDLYAFGDAGIWRSPDRGATWSCSHNYFYPIEIIPFANRLYASSANHGVFVSGDRGTTWKSLVDQVPRADSIPMHNAYYLHAMGRYLFAGTVFGMYRSRDSGATWQRVDGIRLVPGEYSYLQIGEFVELGGKLIANSDSGILISSDSGAAGSWKRIGKRSVGGLLRLGRLLFASGENGFLRSSDQGSTWDTLAAPQEYTAFWSGDPFLYRFTGNDTVFSRSADSGKTWLPLQKGVYFQTLYPKGDSLWVDSWEHGMKLSADSGKHFRDIPVRAGSFRVMGASGDRIALPGFGASADQGQSWRASEPAPTLETMDQVSMEGELAFGHCNINTQPGQLWVSRDGGHSWDSLPPFLGGLRDTSWFSGAAIHLGRLFVARTDGIYRSDDTGATWIRKRVYQGRPFGTPSFAAFLSVGSEFLLADTSGVFRSIDAGEHWLPAKTGITGGIRVLAGNENALYAAGDDGIFRSANDGATWVRVNTARTELANLLAYGGKFLATYDTGGVEVSLDGGATWKRSNEGFSVSNAAVAMSMANSQLYVSVYGGSIWKRSVGEFIPVGLEKALSPEMGADNYFRLIGSPTRMAVAFTLLRPGPVRLEAFDPQGRLITVLAAGPMAPGPHLVPLVPWNRASRVRYLRLSADGAFRYRSLPPGF